MQIITNLVNYRKLNVFNNLILYLEKSLKIGKQAFFISSLATSENSFHSRNHELLLGVKLLGKTGARHVWNVRETIGKACNYLLA